MDLEYDALADDVTADRARIGDNSLRTVSALAEKLFSLNRNIAYAEQTLEALKEERRQVAEQQLPEAMDVVGMTEFKLLSGERVTIKTVTAASLRKEFEAEAVDWLKNNGHGGIVKTAVTAYLPRGATDAAAKVAAEIATLAGVRAEVRETVHPQTFGKFARELLQGGGNLPENLFGVWQGRKAEVV